MSFLLPATPVRLAATGSYLPERVVTSEELAAHPEVPLSADEIVRLTGIVQRHWAAPHEAASDLASAAGRMILQRAGQPSIDRLILSTTSADQPCPSAACLVQHALGLPQGPAVDVAAACAGFLFALDWGARAVLTGDAQVLVLASDVRSRFLNLADRATCALFGDGAGGALLHAGPQGPSLVGLYLQSDGSLAHGVGIPAGGSRRPASAGTVADRLHTVHMPNGPGVFLAAIDAMTDAADALLGKLGLTMSDVDLIVPHQPNKLILDRLCRLMRLPTHKVFCTVQTTGNTSSAALPVALDRALQTQALRPGAHVLLLAAGAGMCSGAALLRIGDPS